MNNSSSFIIGFLCCTALSACYSSPAPVNKDKVIQAEMSDWDDFSITSSIRFKEHIKRDDGSVALTTYDTSLSKRFRDDFSVHLYHFLDSTDCSTSTLGAEHLNSIINIEDKALWVKMEENSIYSGFPDAVCSRMHTTCSRQEITKGTCNDGAATYAFCSKKDDKTVFVCVGQGKDNPTLAKQIFDSFKWTK